MEEKWQTSSATATSTAAVVIFSRSFFSICMFLFLLMNLFNVSYLYTSQYTEWQKKKKTNRRRISKLFLAEVRKLKAVSKRAFMHGSIHWNTLTLTTMRCVCVRLCTSGLCPTDQFLTIRFNALFLDYTFFRIFVSFTPFLLYSMNQYFFKV